MKLSFYTLTLEPNIKMDSRKRQKTSYCKIGVQAETNPDTGLDQETNVRSSSHSIYEEPQASMDESQPSGMAQIMPQSYSLTSEAAKKLKDAREIIFREVKKRKWEEYEEEEGEEEEEEEEEDEEDDEPPKHKTTEGRFRPRLDGTVRKGPKVRMPIFKHATNSNTSASVRVDCVTKAKQPSPMSNQLRKDKRLGKYMVPAGKETPLRESTTMNENA
jgi:hypothetical protein